MKGQVHIHSSDGTGLDMAIVDEDGKKIERVVDATIHFSAGEVARVDLTIVAPGVNVQGQIDDVIIVMPCCNSALTHNCRKDRGAT